MGIQNNNGNRGERLITKTGVLVGMVMGILVGIFGIIFLNSAQEGKLPFSNTSTSHSYNYVKNGMIMGKTTNSEGMVRFIGVLLLIMAVALIIDGIIKLNIFKKNGVDAMPVSQMRNIMRTNFRARNNSSMKDQYNKGSQTNNFSGMFGTKNHSSNNSTANNSTANNYASSVIIECPACKQKLRFPTGKGQIEVTCNRCRYAFFTRT